MTASASFLPACTCGSREIFAVAPGAESEHSAAPLLIVLDHGTPIVAWCEACWTRRFGVAAHDAAHTTDCVPRKSAGPGRPRGNCVDAPRRPGCGLARGDGGFRLETVDAPV